MFNMSAFSFISQNNNLKNVKNNLKLNIKNIKDIDRINLTPEELQVIRSRSITSANTKFFCFIVSFIITALFIQPLMANAEMNNAGSTKMLEYINSGVFDGNGEPSQAEYWGMKLATLVLSWTLPLMSIYIMLMITISVVASVIYNVRPELCDEIHEAHIERKGGGSTLQGMKQVWTNKGIAGFIKSYLPDFKALAFADALEVSSEGRPTLSHFAKNHLIKYMFIFALAMLISEPTMLRFLMNGGDVLAYPVRKVAYMDWTEMARSTFESGRDFNPQYDTRKRADANKSRVYKAIYGTLKELDKSEMARTTDYKALLGSNTRGYIESKMSNIDWENSKLAVKVQYEPNIPQGVELGDGRYAEPVSTFGVTNQTGYIVTYLFIEQNTSAYYQTSTTHRNGWNTVDSTPSSFDLSKVISNAGQQKVNISQALVSYSVIGGSRSEQGTAKASGSSVSLTKPQGVDDKKILQLTVQITYTVGDGAPQKMTASWANPNPDLTATSANKKTTNP